MSGSASSGASGPPILVTGSHRSGSTWIGNVLALAPGTGYIHEPFNRRHRKGICRVHFRHTYTRITAANEAEYLGALRDTLAWRFSPGAQLGQIKRGRDLLRMARDMGYFGAMRVRRARPVMKDPIALFAAEWLASRFGMAVVIAIRHPAAFVASLRAAGWDRFPFADLRDQPLLIEGPLALFKEEILAAAEERPDVIEMGILLWRIFHHEIDRYRREHPDWVFVRHEDLSRDPVPAFRDLFGRLGLAFSAGVEARMGAFLSEGADTRTLFKPGNTADLGRDSRGNIQSWKRRLEPGEIALIRARTADIAERFYGPEDW